MLSYVSRVLVKSADGYTGPGTNNSKAMVTTFLIKKVFYTNHCQKMPKNTEEVLSSQKIN
jgi:hypothetical protein